MTTASLTTASTLTTATAAAHAVAAGASSGARAPVRDGARDAAESFIASSLIQPILKQLRQTNNAAEPFAPGAAEKQFAPLMDQIWAEQMVRASHWPLVDRVAQHLRDNTGIRPGGPSTKTPGPEAKTTAGRASRDFRAPRPADNTARNVLSRRGWLG
jgi:hypothetical protein